MELKDFFNGISEKTKLIVGKEDGDYWNEDGLLMCGKCNTPKQTKINVLGEEQTVYALCKCMTEARDKEQAEQKNGLLNLIRDECFPESNMFRWNFAKDDGKDEKMTRVGKNYVEHFEELKKDGKGLLIYGGVGSGKTYLACCIANALIDKGHRVKFTNFARINNELQSDRQKKIDSLQQYDLLIIDDFDTERDTEYMGELVWNVIDSRMNSGLPMIITTNLTGEELLHATDKKKVKVYDRLMGMCISLKATGDSRRRAKGIEDKGKYKEMLGL